VRRSAPARPGPLRRSRVSKKGCGWQGRLTNRGDSMSSSADFASPLVKSIRTLARLGAPSRLPSNAPARTSSASPPLFSGACSRRQLRLHLGYFPAAVAGRRFRQSGDGAVGAGVAPDGLCQGGRSLPTPCPLLAANGLSNVSAPLLVNGLSQLRGALCTTSVDNSMLLVGRTGADRTNRHDTATGRGQIYASSAPLLVSLLFWGLGAILIDRLALFGRIYPEFRQYIHCI